MKIFTQKQTPFCLLSQELLRTSPKDQGKNLLRNFRRGVLFGMSLKRKNITPQHVLELGSGSGYFSEGLKFVFPEAEITVMDVNKEVLLFNERNHQFKTIENIPETYSKELENKFDLIIARDIIEHVIDIGEVIKNIKSYLKDQGIFHFITPNGHEDVWKHYLTYNELKKKSELLINHVNYFDGKGLLDYLNKNDFSTIEYYTYKLKTTRRGRGWKVAKKLMAPVSQSKKSNYYIEKEVDKVNQEVFEKEDVLNKWYIHKNRKIATFLLSWYHHANLITLKPELNVGHEIYGVFKVNKK